MMYIRFTDLCKLVGENFWPEGTPGFNLSDPQNDKTLVPVFIFLL